MTSSFLSKPYPYNGNLQRDLASNFLIGLFVALFLIVLQPFDTNLWQTNYKFLKLAGFGFISFIVPTVLTFAIQRIKTYRNQEEWTVGAEIGTILLILICIAFGNMLYGWWLGALGLTLHNYFMALLVTLIVGVFPVTFHVVSKHNRMLKLTLQQALELNQQLGERTQKHDPAVTKTEARIKTLRLIAENERDILEMNAEELLYIASADNYSTIIYRQQGAYKKTLMRSSLKRLESQINDQTIVRCHRAYIVNLKAIQKVEGNAAGYRLFLKDCNERVPVSRNYVGTVNELLKFKKEET